MWVQESVFVLIINDHLSFEKTVFLVNSPLIPVLILASQSHNRVSVKRRKPSWSFIIWNHLGFGGALSVCHARPRGRASAPGGRMSQPAHASHVPRACDGAASAEGGDYMKAKHDPCPQETYKSGTNLKCAINTKRKQNIQWKSCFSIERQFLTFH